jgi:hypothetical protein
LRKDAFEVTPSGKPLIRDFLSFYCIRRAKIAQSGETLPVRLAFRTMLKRHAPRPEAWGLFYEGRRVGAAHLKFKRADFDIPFECPHVRIPTVTMLSALFH